MNILKLAGCGFLMGLADLIPGISGGTVAFILGIWQQLIHMLSMFGKPFWKKTYRKKTLSALAFLVPLITGIILAIFLFTKTVDSLLNSYFERTCLYSAFMGLILASSFLCLRSLKSWSFSKLVLFGVGMMTAFFLTNTKASLSTPLYDVPLSLLALDRFEASKIANIDVERGVMTDVKETTLRALIAKGVLSGDNRVIDQNGKEVLMNTLPLKGRIGSIDPWIVFCGAAAIGALLLPGISGSYILVILGMYGDVIGHTADFISGVKSGTIDYDSFFFLAQLALGILLGATIFSQVITRIFKACHDAAMASLGGFVLGSLGAVWPFWSYALVLDPLKLEKGARLVPLRALLSSEEVSLLAAAAIAVTGFCLVLLIEFLAKSKRAAKSIDHTI